MPITGGSQQPSEEARRGDAASRSSFLEVGSARLPGDLVVPEGAVGVVAFAHGSGSSRRSPRNLQVAKRLNDALVGTLLFDLLTPEEGEDRSHVFDIDLLAERLVLAERWLRAQPEVSASNIGFFGASTGAAAALVAAADLGGEVSAVVSRGGRPDLAGEALPHVVSPTLLIVGGADTQVLLLNREAERRMRCERRLEVVAGATHLFEEPGALEVVADLASDWFARHLAGASDGAGAGGIRPSG